MQLLNQVHHPFKKTLVNACLLFKQAQPKMCHFPKVDDGVNSFKTYFF